MSKRTFARPRHAAVLQVLGALNAPFLHHAQCYFGGGTRIVFALDEYRESADIDFLCSSRDGYRDLRATIDSNSLGKITSRNVRLAREVIADRYGIRTFIQVGDDKIKFEIVHEGRIDVTGSMESSLGVPCLDQNSCFAEKFLANSDRWNDESFLSRDVVDLAFMIRLGQGILPEGPCRRANCLWRIHNRRRALRREEAARRQGLLQEMRPGPAPDSHRHAHRRPEKDRRDAAGYGSN